MPDAPTTHPFARSRRANGLAYAHWRLGDPDAALRSARLAATHAGDARHVRLRAMALLMVARVARGTPEAQDALARARVIAVTLEDEVPLARVARSVGRATPTRPRRTRRTRPPSR